MTIFPLAPDRTIAQMWSNGARGGGGSQFENLAQVPAGFVIPNPAKSGSGRIGNKSSTALP